MAETESPGTIARRVMRGADRATLATSLGAAEDSVALCVAGDGGARHTMRRRWC